jgi:hypothetical protein
MASRSRKDAAPRIITVKPGPWRRRKRLVLRVVFENLGDVLLLCAFVGMLLYSLWAFQNPTAPLASHVRLRKGAELPVPTMDNTP